MSSKPEDGSLQALAFGNRFTLELPADPSDANEPRQVEAACYSRVIPKVVAAPSSVAYAREVAADLGLSAATCETQEFADVVSGNQRLAGMDPHAMCYGGHQFGHWAGQLGDGRAINLGEVLTTEGQHLMLQLKGAGPTPYSRTADGLAVLRSSVREFLCSEAMFHLGVPTTRALSLVLTGEEVLRDMFYDGHAKLEPGAVVCRVAPSFLRFGSFEIFTSRGDIDSLRGLADFTIRTEFPGLLPAEGQPTPETYVAWFDEVCRRTADMVVHWARVGFVHGVMNTDNMSILGLTIDYGPYGWLEDYDPNWTPNTTDAQHRRYRFGQQAHVAQWNLAQLATAIYPLVGEAEPLQAALNAYTEYHESRWREMMAAKLGLSAIANDDDRLLATDLLDLLQVVETDMTIFFRALSKMPGAPSDEASESSFRQDLAAALYRPEQVNPEYQQRLDDWIVAYRQRLADDGLVDEERRVQMDAVNPKYVLRNYLAQLAIDKSETGDHSMVCELLEVLRRPYDEQPDKESFAERRPDWARSRPGCSMLSCSS